MNRPALPAFCTLKNIALAAMVLAASPAFAQERVQVVELFSARNCAFCPKADEFFHELIERPGVIGLACHVSYFEADRSSLSRDFCVTRQTALNKALRGGPNFTPEMVANGAVSAIGHKRDMVEDMLKGEGPLRIDVKPIHDGAFRINLPALAEPGAHKISVALIDNPRHFSDPKNKQASHIYKNVVSDWIEVGDWDGTARTLDIQVDLRVENKGFVVLAYKNETMRIVAAGQVSKPAD